MAVRNIRQRRLAAALWALGVGGFAGARQEPAAQQSAADEPTLDAVTVTARKRAETERDVPGGMTVLDRDRLTTVSPTSSNPGLARSAPNVSVVEIGGQASNFSSIRGVGSFSALAPDDTSVVFYVDEAPLTVFGAPPSLLDVERVEVLRGPQGTLFGRNTQGGAVSVVSRQPTFRREFRVTGEAGSGGHGLGELIVNSPLVADRVAGRLALRYSRFGGDIPNAVLGGRDGAVTAAAVRGSLLFVPGERTFVTLGLTHDRNDDTLPRFVLRDAPGFPVSAVDPRTRVDRENNGINLKVRHEADALVLESITTHQRGDSLQRLDLTDGLLFSKVTGLPAAFFNAPGTDTASLTIGEGSLMQEFRLSSTEKSRIVWTAGVNFFRSTTDLTRSGRSTLPNFAFSNGNQDNHFKTTSSSVFGEITVPLAERLRGTLGLRMTKEKREASYAFQGAGLAGVVPAFSQQNQLDDDFATGRAALSYDWSKALITYASVARGYVGGGFPVISVNNPIGKAEPAFAPSTSRTYEMGFKSDLSGRLKVNGAIFLNDVKNGHLVVFDQPNLVFTVATLDYRSRGAELEATARLSERWTLLGGIGYTQAELGAVPPGSLTGARSGNRVPNVPRTTANIGVHYQQPGSAFGVSGTFAGRLAYQYVGSRANDVANSFTLRGYGLVNGRFGWEGRSFDVYAFAYNLLDKRYEASGQNFGPTAQSVFVGQGRIIGVGGTFKF